ncbi:hypothetical protein TNCV_5062301 [Trichonephila clavipes]|nr:hypothetical protein TNCV_5062301 [Trichonephila clavipes]
MVELVKGISKLPDRRLEADRPRHSIQFIDDHQRSTFKVFLLRSLRQPPIAPNHHFTYYNSPASQSDRSMLPIQASLQYQTTFTVL